MRTFFRASGLCAGIGVTFFAVPRHENPPWRLTRKTAKDSTAKKGNPSQVDRQVAGAAAVFMLRGKK